MDQGSGGRLMAWGPHRLPSGLWSATVYTPAGRRSKSHKLKGVVQKWADDLEADIRRGEFIDDRKAEITVAQWWERCKDSRHLELASRKRDQSHWRCHVEPRWGKVRIGAILKPDVETWVVSMTKAGVGATTIEGAVGVLRALLDQAVDAKILRDNQARRVKIPRRSAHVDRVLSPEEETLLLESLERQFPGRPDARLFVEILFHGLRYEEAAAIDREHVDMRRQLVNVGPVLERDGTIRPYPKSPAGERPVPVDDEVWPRFRAHVMTIKPGGLVFTAARGGVLHYSTWHRRVWLRGLLEVTKRGKRGVILEQRPILEDPQPTPHDCRHTFGTRLGEAGVPVHEIMALMGHETLESAQRYLHAGEDRFDRARQAMKRARGL
ncbi:MAG TPA: tyrosine-type recombinase/integrase [Jiangellaceae bacterium]|nr:tyrosine-type recombinase/integrase [Jiangellaceae bacterium]